MAADGKAEKPLRKPAGWKARPLPRGRHGLAREVVQGSQRDRLIVAMLKLVARQGYAKTTVPEVVAAARVSRNAFYQFFADKEACFLAACEQEAGSLIEAIAAATTRGDWIARLKNGLPVYLQWWQDRPELTRAYFLEMPTVGLRAVEQRERAYRPFVDLFRHLARSVPGMDSKDPLRTETLPRMLVIALTEIVAAEVRAGRSDRLTALGKPALYLIVRALGRDADARNTLAAR